MVLIQEAGSGSAEIIHESVNDNDGTARIKFLARLQDTKPNRNKRSYSVDALRAISRGLNHKSQNYGLLGEFEHPELDLPIRSTNRKWTDEELTKIVKANKRNALIKLDRTCIRLNNVRTVGNENIAEGMTTTHNMGEHAYKILRDEQENIGFSCRISGKPSKHGVVIPESITAYTYDFVYMPSHKSAVVMEIFHESTDSLSMLKEINSTIALLENTLHDMQNTSQIIVESSNGIINHCPNGICTIQNLSNTKELRDILIQESFNAITTRQSTILTLKL